MKGKFIYVSAPSGNCGAGCLASVISVAEAVNGRRNAAASADKAGRRTHIELHNRCVTEQTAEFYILADTFSDNGNDANRGGLSVDNTDSYLIGDYTADNVISRPTEQTAVMASSFSIESEPSRTAFIMPLSSDTGMNAPERPPT